MENNIIEFLLKADSKALATFGSAGLNVVPVSTIYVEGEAIILVDYFMDKTVKNILENSATSLTAWSGLHGYQVRCTSLYKKDGELLDKIKNKVKESLPDRVVKGILILRPVEIFDIAPNKDTKEFYLKNSFL